MQDCSISIAVQNVQDCSISIAVQNVQDCSISIAVQNVQVYQHRMASWIFGHHHYGDVTMGAIASQITSLTIVYLTVYSGADQRKHQSSVLLAFVRGIHRGPVNSPHKWPVTRKMFPNCLGHYPNNTAYWWCKNYAYNVAVVNCCTEKFLKQQTKA